MPIAELSNVERALVIGSFLRKDHPLVATRLRAAVKNGAKLSIVHGSDDELLIPTANKIIAAPTDWLAALSEIVAAVAAAKGVAAPAGFENVQAVATPPRRSPPAWPPAKRRPAGRVLLGNAAAHHPQASQLHAAAQWIAEQTGAKLRLPGRSGQHASAATWPAPPSKQRANLFAQPKKAYVLLNAEPELDAANPQQAGPRSTAPRWSSPCPPFKHGFDYADVLLPISPFTRNLRHLRQLRRPRAKFQRHRQAAGRNPSGLESAARAGQPAGPAGLRLRHLGSDPRRSCSARA